MNKKLKKEIIESYVDIVGTIEIRFLNYLTIKNYYNQKDLNEIEKIEIHTVVNLYKRFFNDYLILNQNSIFLEISKFFDTGSDERILSLYLIDKEGAAILYKKHQDTISKINSVRNTSIAHNDKDKKTQAPSILKQKKLISDLKEFFRKSHISVNESDIGFSVGMTNCELRNMLKSLYSELSEKTKKRMKDNYFYKESVTK